MWARAIECTLAAFLFVSSFFLPHDAPLWKWDVSIAAWVAFFSCLSFWVPLRHVRLLLVPAALLLITLAFLYPSSPPPPPYQSYVLLGLIFLITCIVPTHAAEPPAPWIEFYRNKR
jgi:hypothetical protein